MDYEVVIIGSGIVGLAVAANLSKNRSVLVLERNSGFGQETSSRNSEVIHSGIYYPANSLKAKLCVQANKNIYPFLEKNKIPHKRVGKFIVAVNDEDSIELERLLKNAKNNGVENILEFPVSKLKEIEPSIKCVSALWSPDTGIVDSHSFMNVLFNIAKENGADFAFNHIFSKADKKNDLFEIEIETKDGDAFSVTSQYLINAAGLDCDTVAESCGIDIDKEKYILNYAKGHYFRIKPGKSYMANHLIYPTPQKKLAGLGIHLTIDMSGSLKLGPDVQFLNNRTLDYSVPEALQEKFYMAGASYIEGLEFEDLSPDQAGIRPKLQTEGGDFRDFIIQEESGKGLAGLVNLIGIESPGLTSSLEIANEVEKILM
ncbi:MAG TPA: NAD(P)/FAD-dependent oxidoreductase [Candidatus Kapabacteria bacterium]|nr:NAD(P)/FAD-dependent oxidoreductase [Candidatus Kapabacteria bacterium]HPO62734.1 NAD(P)/FAD-dependent oxidoreductase [Candidatus Kapabacteria bacterium]